MNNIKKIIEERLENADLESDKFDYDDQAIAFMFARGQVKAYQDCLNLIPAPRTEQEILNDFENLGWEVTQNDDSCMIICFNNFARIVILKCAKRYSINNLCNMQEHKLLNELFAIWGWF